MGNTGFNHVSCASSFWAEGFQLSALSTTAADGSIDTSISVRWKSDVTSSSRLQSNCPRASFRLWLLIVGIHHLVLRAVKVNTSARRFDIYIIFKVVLDAWLKRRHSGNISSVSVKVSETVSFSFLCCGCGVAEGGRVFWHRVVRHSQTVGFLPTDINFIPVSGCELKRTRAAFSPSGVKMLSSLKFVCLFSLQMSVKPWTVWSAHPGQFGCTDSAVVVLPPWFCWCRFWFCSDSAVPSGWEKPAVSLAASEAFITHWNQRLIL